MRIDPIQIFADALILPPVRFIITWIVGALGCFLPLLIGFGPDAFRSIGLIILLFPFYLMGIVFSSGNYIIVAIPFAIPFAIIAMIKPIQYMINDNEKSDLIIIFTAAYIATFAQAFDRPIIGGLLIPPLIYLCIKASKSENALSSL